MVLDLCGVDKYETTNGTCANVWSWYYSAINTNTRTECSNNPNTTSREYTYTTSWNGTNNCSADYTDLCWIDEYETENGICTTVWIWNYSAANTNEITACSNNPDTTSREYTYTTTWNWTNNCSADYTDKCWIDLYETVNGTCIAVWTWNYSQTNNNETQACDNYPDTPSRDYSYITDWNGSNNCLATYEDLCWIDEYETSNGVCAAVWTGYYSAVNTNERNLCSTSISNSNYITDGNWSNNCSWECNTNYTLTNWVCEADGQNCPISNGTWNQIWEWSAWWTCTVVTCNTDYYNTWNNTCSAVWTWYYSNSTSTSRTICSNNPDTTSRDYTYTSDGNGWNNCSATYTHKCGVDLYETVNGTCAAVWNGWYSLATTNTRTKCTNNDDTTSRDYTYTSDGNGANNCSADYTDLCGVDKYETVNGTCANVGNWYYSLATTNTRTKCTNNEDTTSRNYTYTSDGNGWNNCSATYTDKCWVDEYETENWTCSAVGYWYYSAIWNNWRIACSNWPTDTASRDYNYSYVSDWNGTNSCEYLDWCGSWDMNGDWLITNWEILTALKIYLWKTVDIPESSYSIADVNCDWNINLTDVSKIQSAVIWTITIAEINETSIYTDLCWVDEYETENWTCSAVGYWYYSASWNNGRSSCSNWPTNSTYTSDWNGSNSCTYIQ